MGELWAGLTRTLSRLDAIALEPDVLDGEEAVAALRRLQYRLHLASEHAYGLRPPHGAAEAHADLAASLALARDATAEVVEAATDGGLVAVEPLLYEWRGVLFGVRLARLRLAGPPRPPGLEAGVDPPASSPALRPLAAVLLVAAGAATVVVGARLGLWPVWAAGLVATALSPLVHRSP
jgi:hypothetical protein